MKWIFEKNFAKKAISIEPKNSLEFLTEDDIFNYLEKNPATKSISSHQMRIMFPINEKFNFFTFFFLRHPIDRAFSVYFFKRKEKDDSEGTVKAKQLDLKNFIKWNLEKKGYMVMKNFQTLYLANKDFRFEAKLEDLERAKKIIKKIDVLGTINRIDESLVLAEEVLRPFFKKIDLSYVRQNVSKERDIGLEKRIEDESKIVGEKIMKELEKVNKLDLDLFHECNSELDHRINKVEDFEMKLEKFRKRCNDLAKKNSTFFSKYKKLLREFGF